MTSGSNCRACPQFSGVNFKYQLAVLHLFDLIKMALNPHKDRMSVLQKVRSLSKKDVFQLALGLVVGYYLTNSPYLLTFKRWLSDDLLAISPGMTKVLIFDAVYILPSIILILLTWRRWRYFAWGVLVPFVILTLIGFYALWLLGALFSLA